MNYKAFPSRILLVFVLALPVSAFAGFSKNMSDKRKMKTAETYFTYADFEAALPLYLEMLESSPESWKLNYRAGICYYYSTTSRPRSVSFLDKAVKNSKTDTLPDLLFHAGLAHLCVNDFDNAERCLVAFKQKAGRKYKDPLLDQLIAGCTTGREMWKTPASARVTNLGANVNSKYPDYAPVVIYRSDILLFTSKRPGSTGNDKDDEGFFYEDIYQAKGESWNRWKEPMRYDTSTVKRRGIFSLLFNKAEVVSEINTEDHDGSITLSPDSTDLYIFRYGDIMKANWDGKRWQRPSRIGEEIDMRASHEPSIFLSRDGNTMFFVSDRKGGVGQKDIWVCDKENGNWGKPHNLGLEVNTPFNEDSPFLSPDGMTLYFSSEGHNSMGGYDVFKCTRQKNGMWSEPVNLGAPVNNGGDDIFYTPLENGAGAYYASLNREGDGDLDLFFVQYFPEVIPMAKLRLNANGLDPKDKVNIKISTPEGTLLNEFNLASTDSFMYPYNPSAATTYEISAPGFKPVKLTAQNQSTSEEQFMLQQLNITRNDSTTQVSLANYSFDIDSALNPVALADPFVEFPVMRTNYLDSLSSVNALTTRYTSSNTSGSGLSVDYFPPGTEFASLYFDFDRAELSVSGKSETDKLVAWMLAHPGRKVEIIGHADENGDALYNQKLSEQRAVAVKDALIAAGISPDRVVAVGKGETEPAVDTRSQEEKTADPGRMNRRVTVRILE